MVNSSYTTKKERLIAFKHTGADGILTYAALEMTEKLHG